MVKVRFKMRANVVFNENELVYVDESRVKVIEGVVVIEKADEPNIPKAKKEVN